MQCCELSGLAVLVQSYIKHKKKILSHISAPCPTIKNCSTARGRKLYYFLHSGKGGFRGRWGIDSPGESFGLSRMRPSSRLGWLFSYVFLTCLKIGNSFGEAVHSASYSNCNSPDFSRCSCKRLFCLLAKTAQTHLLFFLL